jgi:hypothetical protein
VQSISKEVPWDIFDRLFLPVLYCHAVAILFSAILNVFEVKFAFSTFGVFILLSIATITLTLFYHNLKVRKLIFFIWGQKKFFVCVRFNKSLIAHMSN